MTAHNCRDAAALRVARRHCLRCFLLMLPLMGTALWANPETTVQLPGGATMDFVWIEPGTFTMGSGGVYGRAFEDESPPHQVTLTQGYWLGKYEVTQGQWQAVMGTAPWSGWPYVLEDASCPVAYIRWEDTQGLCAALTAAGDGAMYRLPTEAEWEYACRAGASTLYCCGDDTLAVQEYGWFYMNAWDLGITYAQPVGTLLPNAWGVHDMHGNVAEWVQDWYGEYPGGAQIDPTGPPVGEFHQHRGGCFRGPDVYVRCAARMREPDVPDWSTWWLGMRLVRQASGPTTGTRGTTWGQVKESLLQR